MHKYYSESSISMKSKKVWKKTDTCNLLENILGLQFEQNSTEIACRLCVDKFQTLSKNKNNHLKSLEKALAFLKEK